MINFFVNVRFKFKSQKEVDLSNFNILEVFETYSILQLFKTDEGYPISKKTYKTLKPHLKLDKNGALILYTSQIKTHIDKVDDNDMLGKVILESFL